MRTPITPLKLLAFASVLLVGSLSAFAQSAYFEAVTNLNPVLYFPLQETTQPPIGDVETNYGSLGSAGNAVYSSANVSKGQGGATLDGDTSVLDTDAQGGFLAVPTTDQRTAVQSPTFTVECWVNPAETGRNFEGIVAKSGPNNGGINGVNNQAGWCLSENYIAYLDNANMIGFDFHVFNGVGHGGAEVVVPFNVQVSTWYHLVATFDGVNCWLYINGTNMIANGFGYQIPMTGSYVADTWNPIQIGSSRGLNGNNYHGNIDEVAIYTNVLSATQVLNHYNAAFSASPYSTTILADNPYMYWRMDSPGYTAPDPSSTYPVGTNYGNYPSTVGGLYGTMTQPGVPGPQFPGMLDPNNGNQSFGMAVNGIGGNNGNVQNIQYGYDALGNAVLANDAVPFVITNLSHNVDPNTVLIDPTNHAPFSFTIWFRGNPDYHDRFQTLCGCGDSGWRFNMVQGPGVVRWNPGAGGEVNTPYAYNDGNWHDFVGTYDGSNILTYVDGVLVVTTVNTSTNAGSTYFPMLGGPPDYLSSGNNYGVHNGYSQRHFSGSLAHFAFFTNALTAAQVQNLYSTAVPNQAPYILGQPVTGRVNPPPGFLFFGVVAGGTGPLSYQWYYNAVSNYSGATQLVDDGVKYAGSTTSQVAVSNLVAADSGYYYVVVTNNLGSVTSILASLKVNYTPVITAQNPTANFDLYPGQIFPLSVTATADTNASVSPLSYYWFSNSVSDANGTNASYAVGPVTSANNGESFYCIVSNSAGTATSAPVTVTVLPFPAVLTNNVFSSNILALHPTAYWPMHDAGQTPAPASIETNYGTLGQIANAYYDDWRQPLNALGGNLNAGGVTNDLSLLHNFPSAIAGDADPSVQLSGANRSYLVVPRVSPTIPGTTPGQFTIRPPFTLEAWFKPSRNSFGIMLGQDMGVLNNGNSNVRGGFDWLYSGTANTFSMTVYSGNGGASSEPKTAANYPPGPWYHVVTTYDGTNVQYYINGVADAMTGVNGTNGTYALMNPNTWDPVTIGCGRGLNNAVLQGALDEVAVYTNLLSPTEILKHYNDGTNASFANYKQDVLNNNPLYYYRMDAPAWSVPPTNTWPVLTNFGSAPVNGLYTPGSVPAGGPAPSEDGHPIVGLPASNSLQQNGVSIFADGLNTPAFHPGSQVPETVAAWVKGNPADAGGHNWQGFVSDSDGSWRLDINGGSGRANFNPNMGQDTGNSTTTGAAMVMNDGQWHWVVGTYDGSKTIVYVDGIVSATWTTNHSTSSVNAEPFIGAYPNNAAYGNTPTSLANEIGRVFAGSTCEAAFWNGTALSSNQIQALYSSLQIAPVIDQQPISASPNSNTGFTNSVLATGSGPITYQWYNNGSPMPVAGQTNLPFGATNATLIISPTKLSDSGSNYYVIASNPYGSATSAVWTLNVIATAPEITSDIANTNVSLFPGGHATFGIATVGQQPIIYQWYSNNVAIPGASGSSFTLQNAQPPSSVQNYYCVATNTLGVATSLVAVVNVLPIPAASYPQTILADNPLGFWRLNESPDNGSGNNGTLAFDSWGGNNGIYTNASLNQFPGYNTNCESTLPSAQFGILVALSNSMVFNIPTNVDFATNSGAEFSVECWVNGFAQTSDAGLVSKGTGAGGEEFALDTGAPNHAFRFYMRITNTTVYNVNSTVVPDGNWHHLVAVCDENNGTAWLYIDGIPAASNSIPPQGGIFASTQPIKIGSRPSGADPNGNVNQFQGNISDVSIYSHALTYSNVLNHYLSACVAAHVGVQPTNTWVSEGGNATFSAITIGTPAISNQWFIGSPGFGTPIIGATNMSLTLSNLSGATNGNTFYIETDNQYGTNDSQVVSVNVITGIPVISNDVPAVIVALEGEAISVPITAYGTLPLYYQWQRGDANGQNFANLSDTTRITGTQTSTLTIGDAQTNDVGTYQVIITNNSGFTTSSVASMVVVPAPLNFFNALGNPGWSTNGSARFYDTNVLVLTDNSGGNTSLGNGSSWFGGRQYIAGFKATFTYIPSGEIGADGVAFCLQNDPRGTTALGGGGGGLGVSGITPSWELELNIYPNQGVGYAIHVNGATGGYVPPGSVVLNSGDPIQVNMLYAQGQMALTFTDLVAATSFSTTVNVGDMTQIVGGQTALVGFTGAYGGSHATQTITNFNFVSLTSAAIKRNPNSTATITWPGIIGGYTLQQSPSLSAPNWVNVTNQDIYLNGQHTITVPTGGGTNEFYRLSSPF